MPHRPPVDPGRFHRHLAHALGDQPVPQLDADDAVNVRNSRTSCTRLPPPSGLRTHAITVSLCTSSAAHRSTITSIDHPLVIVDETCRPWGPACQESETRARSNNQGACKPPRQSDLRAHGTTERYDVSGRHTIFIPNRDPTRGHVPVSDLRLCGGRYGTRTHDLCRVNSGERVRSGAGQRLQTACDLRKRLLSPSLEIPSFSRGLAHLFAHLARSS